MVIESIREFNRAVPFRPYRIRMASGDLYLVPHADLVTVSPRGSIVIVFDDKERPHHLSSLLIESVSPATGSARGSSRKRAGR